MLNVAHAPQEFRNMSDTIPHDAQESELVARLTTAREAMLAEMHRVIVGQDEVLEQLI